MRILYGVQGTGNGHLTRAIAMTETIKQSAPGSEVHILISGRMEEKLPIRAAEIVWHEGATFAVKNGEVQLKKTILNLSLRKLIRDISQLKLKGYNLIITDYEPIVAWAAKISGREVIGIGHQYAFYYNIPIQGGKIFSKNIMKIFAPANKKVGLHWHHFNQPLLPPIINIAQIPERKIQNNKVLVYLPFEDTQELIKALQKISDYEFYVYHPEFENVEEGNIHKRKISRTTFKDELITSSAVICNTGFQLISECLTLGIRIFTKPLGHQIEQQSNGLALSKLGYATVVSKLSTKDICSWLKREEFTKVSYPNTQYPLTNWLLSGASQPLEELSDSLWAKVSVHQ